MASRSAAGSPAYALAIAAAGFAPCFFGVALAAGCGAAAPPGAGLLACRANAGALASARQTIMAVTCVFIRASRRAIEDSGTTPRRNLAGRLTHCPGRRSVAPKVQHAQRRRT